jgi:antirestriction protein ArdC
VKDIYEALTDRMLAQLERGVVPWQRPWRCIGHQNLISRKPYQGINALVTGISPYDSPYWLSFKQALDLGGAVKKGERHTPIIFWKPLDRSAAGEETQEEVQESPRRRSRSVVRYRNVFNLEQTEGIEPPKEEQHLQFEPIKAAKTIVEKANLCPIQHGGNEAGWAPALDIIVMPGPGQFKSSESYYHTLFHEMAHATGHAQRLNRPGCQGKWAFGTPVYAKEELIAEMSACFLSNQAGTMKNIIFGNAAAYTANWLKVLREDKRIIVSVASQAQKAVSYINGEDLDLHQSPEPAERIPQAAALRPHPKPAVRMSP